MAAAFNDDEDSSSTISDINVTPLVDITLLLLIVMMVAAPLLAGSISSFKKVNYAQTSNATPSTTEKNAIVTLIKSDTKPYELFLNGVSVSDEQFLQEAKKIAQNPTAEFTVAADKLLPYDHVMHILDLLTGAGAAVVNLGAQTTIK